MKLQCKFCKISMKPYLVASDFWDVIAYHHYHCSICGGEILRTSKGVTLIGMGLILLITVFASFVCFEHIFPCVLG